MVAPMEDGYGVAFGPWGIVRTSDTLSRYPASLTRGMDSSSPQPTLTSTKWAYLANGLYGKDTMSEEPSFIRELTAFEEWELKRMELWHRLDATIKTANTEYDKAVRPAREHYDKVRRAADAAYADTIYADHQAYEKHMSNQPIEGHPDDDLANS